MDEKKKKKERPKSERRNDMPHSILGLLLPGS